jgi:hypothetical protein
VTDQLDYASRQLQDNTGMFSGNDVQMGLQMLYDMSQAAKDAHQDQLYNKFDAERKNYETKFAALFRQQ